MARPSALTPMIQQVFELQAEAGDAILFFRMGDFYEIFGDQAVTVAPLLGLTLTRRDKNSPDGLPFCGVPHHSRGPYIQKLLSHGFSVAVAEQEAVDGAGKVIMTRRLVRTYTPSTADDPELVSDDQVTYLATLCLSEDVSRYALAFWDVTTGSLLLAEAVSGDEAREWLRSYEPREIWVRRFEEKTWREFLAQEQGLRCASLSVLPEAPLRDPHHQAQILGEALLDGVQGTTARALVAATLVRLKSMGVSTGGVFRVSSLEAPESFKLQDQVIRDLELFETARGRRKSGSLVACLDRTLTLGGKRLLRQWLICPLHSPTAILERRSVVRAWVNRGEMWLAQLRRSLSGVGDMARLVAWTRKGQLPPASLLKLVQSAQSCLELSELTGLPLDEPKAGTAEQLAQFISKVQECVVNENPRLGHGFELFCPDFDSELPRLRALAHNGDTAIQAYVDRLRQETGISSLKVKTHKTWGLTLEVTNTHLEKVPATFVRKQTMVGGERFVTAELSELAEELLTAQEQAIEREAALYDTLLHSLARYLPALSAADACVGRWDCLQSFAWNALRFHYCEPTLNDRGEQPQMILEACRHPVVEHILGPGQFTPNDLRMHAGRKCAVITGPNMAGKSTLMRQVAICALMHQIGAYVPAQSAKLPIFDSVYTRVGAADDLAAGLSTFMVEMSEASLIARFAGPSSLVLIDELGRGTSSQDGVAIATAMLGHLCQRAQAWTLFATHFHELAAAAKAFPSAFCLRAVVDHGPEGQLTFSHRIEEGISGRSYGLEVAALAGVPEAVLADARAAVQALMGEPDPDTDGPSWTEALAALQTASHDPSAPQLRVAVSARAGDPMLFGALRQVLALDLTRVTPFEALTTLHRLQSDLRHLRENLHSDS